MEFDELKKLTEAEGLKYFVAPDRPVIMLGMVGIFGRYQMVIPLELDGRFLQFRTVGYLSCPADHPHVDAVLRVLGELNYRLRLTKFAWDPTDGEIAAFVDIWLEDGTLTQRQFTRMLQSFIPGIDLNYLRLTRTIETGTDPGELRPEDISSAAPGLPPGLRGLIDRLTGKQPRERPREPEGPIEI